VSVASGSTGVGPESTIVNGRDELVPPGVETVTSRSPVSTAEAIVNPAERLLLSITVTPVRVTPGPLTETVVAPGTKFVPPSIKRTEVPEFALTGEIDVRVGAPTGKTVKSATLFVVPVVIVIVESPMVALKASDKLVVNVVELVTFTAPTVIPLPLAVTVVCPCTKFEPVIVTGTTLPTTPL
jgi:hypothetical protein